MSENLIIDFHIAKAYWECHLSGKKFIMPTLKSKDLRAVLAYIKILTPQEPQE